MFVLFEDRITVHLFLWIHKSNPTNIFLHKYFDPYRIHRNHIETISQCNIYIHDIAPATRFIYPSINIFISLNSH